MDQIRFNTNTLAYLERVELRTKGFEKHSSLCFTKPGGWGQKSFITNTLAYLEGVKLRKKVLRNTPTYI